MYTFLKNAPQNNSKIEEGNKKLKEKLNSTNERLQKQESYLNDLEQYTRRNSIQIHGLNDRDKDEPAQKNTNILLDFLTEKLGITMKSGDIYIYSR